jgi:pectinesterase
MNMKRNIILTLIAGFFVFAIMPQKKITIHMAGDSTMADKKPDKFPETGWGMAFKNLFNENVQVVNYAANGRSTKSFISENRWQKLVDNVKEGDYVFIQFGHNDEKVDKPGVGTTLQEYEANLTRFVKEVQAKNAFPVLCTPVMRRSYTDGHFTNSHGEYPASVKKVAAAMQVPLIDMLETSRALLEKTGIEESKKFYLIADSAVWANYPKGITDNTHFRQEGAEAMAAIAIESIKELKLPLKKYIKRK